MALIAGAGGGAGGSVGGVDPMESIDWSGCDVSCCGAGSCRGGDRDRVSCGGSYGDRTRGLRILRIGVCGGIVNGRC